MSVEIFPEFSAAAQEKLRLAGISNVVLRAGDGARAQAAVLGAGGFDVIVLTGSTPVLPGAFLDALNPRGRLFAVVGDAPVMKAVLMAKTPTGSIVSTEVFETQLAVLINAEQPERFKF